MTASPRLACAEMTSIGPSRCSCGLHSSPAGDVLLRATSFDRSHIAQSRGRSGSSCSDGTEIMTDQGKLTRARFSAPHHRPVPGPGQGRTSSAVPDRAVLRGSALIVPAPRRSHGSCEEPGTTKINLIQVSAVSGRSRRTLTRYRASRSFCRAAGGCAGHTHLLGAVVRGQCGAHRGRG